MWSNWNAHPLVTGGSVHWYNYCGKGFGSLHQSCTDAHPNIHQIHCQVDTEMHKICPPKDMLPVFASTCGYNGPKLETTQKLTNGRICKL